MATRINPKTYDVLENSPVVPMASFALINGVLAKKADVSSIQLRMFVLNDDGVTANLVVPAGETEGVYEYTTLDKNVVVKDTPVTPLTDVRWEDDDVGANMVVELDGSYVPHGNKIYKAEMRIVPTTGTPFSLVPWIFKTYNLFTFAG